MGVPKRFFIVDDDADDLELFMEAVGEVDKHIKCYSSSDGEQALHQLKNGLVEKPDLIFLDLNMPRLNGKQCLVELKKHEALSAIPVIIYSTSSETKDVEEARRLGAAHFMTKPNRFDELCRAIKEVITSF